VVASVVVASAALVEVVSVGSTSVTRVSVEERVADSVAVATPLEVTMLHMKTGLPVGLGPAEKVPVGVGIDEKTSVAFEATLLDTET